MTDWGAWHEQYDDAETSLSRRLLVVQAQLRALLDDAASVRRVLSLCAGDGRDVLPVLAELPEERRPEVTLVELGPRLAAAARSSADALDVAATVITGDAGVSATWRHVVPVDLLLLCGIFGNVTDADVRSTIGASPAALRPGGAIVWTRGHRGGADVRPQVRQWFAQAGYSEVAFDAEPIGYGVGVARLTSQRDDGVLPDRLFAFVR